MPPTCQAGPSHHYNQCQAVQPSKALNESLIDGYDHLAQVPSVAATYIRLLLQEKKQITLDDSTSPLI
jgi:hypothetical protein